MYDTLEHQNDKLAARNADNVLEMILEKEKEDHLKGNEPLTRSEILDELAGYAIAGSECMPHHHFQELRLTNCIFSNGDDDALVGQIFISSPCRSAKALSRACG
jgi:hypothetical protein